MVIKFTVCMLRSCRCEQLDASDRILECLPMALCLNGSSDGWHLLNPTRLSEELLVLHKDIDKLEDHLR